jgi:hypothetical protein
MKPYVAFLYCFSLFGVAACSQTEGDVANENLSQTDVNAGAAQDLARMTDLLKTLGLDPTKTMTVTALEGVEVVRTRGASKPSKARSLKDVIYMKKAPINSTVLRATIKLSQGSKEASLEIRSSEANGHGSLQNLEIGGLAAAGSSTEPQLYFSGGAPGDKLTKEQVSNLVSSWFVLLLDDPADVEKAHRDPAGYYLKKDASYTLQPSTGAPSKPLESTPSAPSDSVDEGF